MTTNEISEGMLAIIRGDAAQARFSEKHNDIQVGGYIEGTVVVTIDFVDIDLIREFLIKKQAMHDATVRSSCCFDEWDIPVLDAINFGAIAD
jgi:hypothetical protein